MTEEDKQPTRDEPAGQPSAPEPTPSQEEVLAPASVPPETIAPASADTEEDPAPESAPPPAGGETNQSLSSGETSLLSADGGACQPETAEATPAAIPVLTDAEETPPLTNSGAAPPLASGGVDNFPIRFKARLKELSLLGVEKRRRQADERIEKIFAFAREHNRIDNKDARELTGLSDERVRYYLNKLEKEGKLEQFGQKGQRVFYMPIRDR